MNRVSSADTIAAGSPQFPQPRRFPCLPLARARCAKRCCRYCWSTEESSMKKRVLICVVLACAVTATNASAQVITDMIKRVGAGGSVGTMFTFDDEVNVGVGVGLNVGLAPKPGLSPTLGFGWYQGC